MITLTGNGRLTRDVQLRTTHSGKTVATLSIASDRRDRDADPVYLDLIVWQAQATAAAAEHLVKGQAISFAGRFEPREYVTNSGEDRVALELHGVDLEYGPKPRGDHAGEPRPAAGRRDGSRGHPVLSLRGGRVAGRAALPGCA
jgi:single-strand DNA-binding protein